MTDRTVQPSAPANSAQQRKTFCGICEASCGLVVTVRNDTIIAMRPDPEHPSSRGFACAKGVQFDAVVADPDRVTQPMRRVAEDCFEPATWDEALDDIGRRMHALRNQRGDDTVGVAWGNPTAWNLAGAAAIQGMAVALKTRHNYTTASLDVNNYYVASNLLYGHPGVNPLPDFASTDFALIVGSNPFVSHGSLVTTGNIREVLLDITRRQGRVIVVDPRLTETAACFEHIPIVPGADAWFVAALLKIILDEGLHDAVALKRQASGLAALHAMVKPIRLSQAEKVCGIPSQRIVEVARELAGAKTACVYGRCGASLGPFSSLTKYFLDCLAIVTGNLDRRGGMVFGDPLIDKEFATRLSGQAGVGRWHTRVERVPEVMGAAPFSCLPGEIVTAGKDQLRSLLICSANPVTSAPGNIEMEAALRQLELLVCIDPYITDTSRLAHWILPPTLWLEREQFPVYTEQHATIPHAQWVAPVVPPRGDARDDGWIIDQICQRIGIVPSLLPGAQWLGKLGIRIDQNIAADIAVRTGRHGDWFGLRPHKLSRKKLLGHQGAVKVADACPVDVLRKKIWHRDKRVHLAQRQMYAELSRMLANDVAWPDYPLRLFSIREYRSHNSWLHNVPKLMAANRKCKLKMHPDDADRFTISDRSDVTVTSPWGKVKILVETSNEIMAGTVGMTQGWGHRGTWKQAVNAGGVSYNRLTPLSAQFIDRLSGNAWLNGIPVTVHSTASTVDDDGELK